MVISPQKPTHSRRLIERHALNFDILFDENLKIAKLFNLDFELPDDLREIYSRFGINLPEVNGTEKWELPMPSQFVVDRSEVVRFANVNADYKIRPEPSETLKKITELV